MVDAAGGSRFATRSGCTTQVNAAIQVIAELLGASSVRHLLTVLVSIDALEFVRALAEGYGKPAF